MPEATATEQVPLPVPLPVPDLPDLKAMDKRRVEAVGDDEKIRF